jgi:hypothetical protein
MAQMKAMQEQMVQLAQENVKLREHVAAPQYQGSADVGPVTDERFARRVVIKNKAADADFVRTNLPYAIPVHADVVGLPKEGE